MPAVVESVEPAITVAGVSKSFASGTRVLDDVSLTVERGEFLCLLGSSGSGKSTLLGLIAGLDAPSAGTVRVPSGPAAVMFQDSTLFPWLSARRNIDLALRLRGVDRASRRGETERLLELVGLGSAGRKRPHELSGGMRQRVSLARALSQEREVLLMDEPFGALDATTRSRLHGELLHIWRETGRTIVFVTHDIREAVHLGQRIVLLSSNPGRIVREWRAGDVSFGADESGLGLATEINGVFHEQAEHHVI